MIVEKIQVKGQGKETAELSFDKGLNVIAGASDTGKSYITKCIQFILGSKKPPKAIKESKGYTNLEVSFKDDNGGRFILKRELSEKSDVVVEIGDGKVTNTLKPSHKGKNNLSDFFLKKINLNDKIIAKGIKTFTHSSLTLRILENIFVIDEHRILAEHSPLGKGQHTETTLELSLLKTLLTGIDDAEITKIKGRKHSKEILKRKIESIEDILEAHYPDPDSSEFDFLEIDKQLERIVQTVSSAKEDLFSIVSQNREHTEQRKQLSKEIGEIEDLIREERTLTDRFILLMKKYQSDKERLFAGAEAAHVMNEYEILNCPTCGREFKDDPTDLNYELIAESTNFEIKKLDLQLHDLGSTIEDQRNNIAILEKKHSEKQLQLDRTNEKIDSSIGKNIDSYNSIVDELMEKKSELIESKNVAEKRKNLMAEIGKLQNEFDRIIDSYEISDFQNELNKLCTEIGSILKRWGFIENPKVTFSTNNRDIVIDGKPRSHFGKGYRAISFSAFVIGLLNLVSQEDRHPGFVLLDSPLTTYKRADKSIDEEEPEEQIAHNIIYAFYRDLCDFYKDKQIIVLENREPDSDLIGIMNYHHFSKNRNIGRYGFFPI
jgi:hypothetical protein